jgi:hypothetical protein
MGAALVSVAYFNWRFDWNYRYAKWLGATLFGLRKPFGELADAKFMRVFYRELSSGFLVLFGGILLILGISLFGR